jgi:hypothetical protein
VSSAQGLKIKRVCIKCKPGFKNPKALSTEVMPSDISPPARFVARKLQVA